MECRVETEDDHMVIGLDMGVTGHDHAMSVANQSADG